MIPNNKIKQLMDNKHFLSQKKKRNPESTTIGWKSNCKTKKNRVRRLFGDIIC